MGNAYRDENRITTLLAVSSSDGTTPVTLYADPTTHRLLVDLAGSGTGDVSGPGAAVTDNAVVRWHTTSGTDIQNSIVEISDTGILAPVTTDTGQLGSTTLMWGDLFLASGGVINFNNGNVTLTHSAGVLTLGGTATLALGTNSITMTGSLGTTGARLTKGWFTDLEVTNAIAGSITGTAAVATTATAADEAADTTCFLTFVTAATGNLGIKTNANLTFNSSTGVATFGQTIAGSITGNAGTATALETARTIGGTSFNGTANIVPATITVADEATDTSCFLLFATAATGDLGPKTNTNLTFNSNTGVLTSASLVATTADINGGTVDGATIGASSASSIIGTTIDATTDFTVGGTVITNNTITDDGTLIINATTATSFSEGNITNVGDIGLDSLTADATNINLNSPLQLTENAPIMLDAVMSADEKYSGITTSGTLGATIGVGDLVYLAAADSRWELADASAATTSGNVPIAICLVAGNDGDATTLLLVGKVRSAAFPAFTVATPIYVSETAGDITGTAPTTTDSVMRRVGFALTAEDLYFNPSNDYVTHV